MSAYPVMLYSLYILYVMQLSYIILGSQVGHLEALCYRLAQNESVYFQYKSSVVSKTCYLLDILC